MNEYTDAELYLHWIDWIDDVADGDRFHHPTEQEAQYFAAYVTKWPPGWPWPPGCVESKIVHVLRAALGADNQP